MDDFQTKTGVTAAHYMRKHGQKPVTLKTLMGTLDPLIEQMVALEKRDANALLSAAAMRRLESQALAVRDRCQGFLYTRAQPQLEAGSTEIPTWLR